MEKWVITPAPTAHDPHRHLLLVQGRVGELSPLLKRFGATCGRPAPLKSPEGYNLRLYLHGLSPGGLEAIRALLGELAPAPSLRSPPERASLVPLEAAPAPASPRPAPPAPQGRRQASPWGEEPLWGLRERPDPLRHLDSLLVGAYNRFAHAAASSVISAPGAMYNPLFLHGPPGTGKTHTLQAIAVGLSRSLGEGSVVLTSGPRLACAVSAALSEGGFGEIEAFLGKAKALLVDDIHLLAVTEHNRAALARVLGLFPGRALQVAFASLYPPKALGALEDSLRLSFERGAVDLKPPGPAAQLEIIRAFCDRNGVVLNAREINAFHERLGPNAFEAVRWLRRLAAMTGLPELASRAPGAEEMIPLLFEEAPIPREGGVASGELEPGSLDFPTATQLEGLRGFPPPAPGARRLAVLAPQGEEERLSPWMVARFHQAGVRYGLREAYRLVLVASYDPGQPSGVPFEIGEKCLKAGAQAVLIMGPPDHSSLAGQAAEFSHAVGHILESLGIAMAAIPWRGTTSDGNFLRAHLDLLAPRYG